MRPLLLMDVDGPLNPFGARWMYRGTPPDGFTVHRLSPDGFGPFRVALNPWHGARLRGLADRFDLVWASTWQGEANRMIAPLLGMPDDLPFIPMSRPWVTPARCWKSDVVAAWANGRPFAWFDDEINRATRRFLARWPGIGPHLALRTDPTRGLTENDFVALERFAYELRTGSDDSEPPSPAPVPIL